MDNNKGKLEISELFMAQADINRRFYGTIKRGCDADGIPVVRGRIEVQDGFVLAQAGCQDDLGTRLDELVLMVLDMDLHRGDGATSLIAGIAYFFN